MCQPKLQSLLQLVTISANNHKTTGTPPQPADKKPSITHRPASPAGLQPAFPHLPAPVKLTVSPMTMTRRQSHTSFSRGKITSEFTYTLKMGSWWQLSPRLDAMQRVRFARQRTGLHSLLHWEGGWACGLSYQHQIRHPNIVKHFGHSFRMLGEEREVMIMHKGA